MKRSMIKGAAWVSVGRIGLAALSFVSTIILARLLTPEDFGLVALASAAAMIVATLTELPLSQAIIQHDNPEDDHLHTIWTFGLIKGVAMFAVIAAAAYPLAWAYGDDRLTGLLLVLACSAALGSFQNPAIALFERDLVFWQNVVLDLLDKLMGLIVSVAVAVIYQSYWALVLGVLASAATRLMLSYIVKPYRPKIRVNKARELLSFSVWLTLGSWVQALNWRADPLVIGAFVAPGPLGLYTMAGRLSKMSVTQALSPISRVLFPALSRMKQDRERLRRAYLRVQAITCTIAFPMAAGLAVLAEPIVKLVLSEKWLPAVPLVQGIVLISALRAIHHASPLALATGRTKALFHRDTYALMVRAPLLFGGILIGQATAIGVLMGAVAGRFLATAAMALWNMTLVREIANLPLRMQFWNAFRPFAASILMIGSLWLVLQNISPISQDLEGYLSLAGLIALGAVIYVVALFVLWFVQGRKEGPETEALAGLRQAWHYGRAIIARRPMLWPSNR